MNKVNKFGIAAGFAVIIGSLAGHGDPFREALAVITTLVVGLMITYEK